MKNFTNADVTSHGAIQFAGSIYTNSIDELIHSPLEWQNRGVSQTASGYGAKLTSTFKIQFEGKAYRLYTTCFSNAGSTWFKVKGKKIFVN